MDRTITWVCRWCGRKFTKKFSENADIKRIIRPRICVECFIDQEEVKP
jgi:hypothetical protein